LDEDRDLQILRDEYPTEWKEVTAQLAATKPGAASELPGAEKHRRDDAGRADEADHGDKMDCGAEVDRTAGELPPLERYPDWPWPVPTGRAGAWGFLALLCIAGAVADAAFSITDTTLPWIVGLCVLLAFCSWRASLAIREASQSKLVTRSRRTSSD
jgi:hypothetical protein